MRSGCGTPSLPVSGGLRLDVSGGLPVVRDVDWGVRGWEEPQEVVLPVWLWHSLGYCCRDSRSEAIRIRNRQAVSQDVWYRSMNIDLRGKMSILSELKRIKCTLKLLVCVHKNVLLDNQLWLRSILYVLYMIDWPLTLYYDSCWLDTSSSVIWSFVGPTLAVILFNIVMLSIAVYMMHKHANTLALAKGRSKYSSGIL